MIPVDKKILNDYIDACENIKETEAEIRELNKRKKTIIQTNVTGSNPDFPYEKQHFKIQGMQFSYSDERALSLYKKTLEERKNNAQELKVQVEQWLNTIPNRMQRIIRYKIFEEMTWEQVAVRIGRKATADSIRMEFNNFMK